jgi:oligopeptide/dipeptide ABC transporter ATP-binding protein
LDQTVSVAVGAAALLRVSNLSKTFPIPGSSKVIHACQDVSFDLAQGETLGLVGESGSGKTTLGRCVLRLIEPSGGRIVFEGKELTAASQPELRRLRSQIRIVFQEPVTSFNPRYSIGYQIAEPLRIHLKLDRKAQREKVTELLSMVGLPSHVAHALPGSLSAGTAQRCSIARAISTSPKLIVLDEPTSALAPEAEAELVRLLRRLQDQLGVSYIFISHNLSLVGEISHRIAVMYLSQVVETGTVAQVFEGPQHPYTRALLAANLLPDTEQRRMLGKRWERLGGEIPSPIDLPVGCYLASRCLYVKERCRTEPQSLQPAAIDRRPIRCWRAAEGFPAAEIEAVRQAATRAINEKVEQEVAQLTDIAAASDGQGDDKDIG